MTRDDFMVGLATEDSARMCALASTAHRGESRTEVARAAYFGVIPRLASGI
jgi:hypothetical protein